uniref:Uncharacterized protein n=1 Tax=Anguilla anguilla TaxID=7936 RepID=A0A0E9PTD1_ANGAN
MLIALPLLLPTLQLFPLQSLWSCLLPARRWSQRRTWLSATSWMLTPKCSL